MCKTTFITLISKFQSAKHNHLIRRPHLKLFVCPVVYAKLELDIDVRLLVDLAAEKVEAQHEGVGQPLPVGPLPEPHRQAPGGQHAVHVDVERPRVEAGLGGRRLGLVDEAIHGPGVLELDVRRRGGHNLEARAARFAAQLPARALKKQMGKIEWGMLKLSAPSAHPSHPSP